MTIISSFYVDNFNTYGFNLDLQNNNNIFIMFLGIIVHFSICIYNVSYIIFKINISVYTCRIQYIYRICAS